jgi:putative chitinase
MMPFIATNSTLFLNTFVRQGIVTPLRIAHFLTQVHNETGGFVRFRENLNYTPEGLLKTFKGRITTAQANQYGRTGTHKANQEAIANIVYGGSWGKINLGNTQKGDGWKYRGRGLLQLTGRANYEAYKSYSGIDVVANPELVATLRIGLDVAGWFWNKKGINQAADKNDITGVTKKVNGGNIGLSKRTILLQFYKKQNITLDTLKKKGDTQPLYS